MNPETAIVNSIEDRLVEICLKTAEGGNEDRREIKSACDEYVALANKRRELRAQAAFDGLKVEPPLDLQERYMLGRLRNQSWQQVDAEIKSEGVAPSWNTLHVKGRRV